MHSVQLSTQPALSLHFFCITDIYWTVSFNEVQGYLWSCLIKVTQKQAFFLNFIRGLEEPSGLVLRLQDRVLVSPTITSQSITVLVKGDNSAGGRFRENKKSKAKHWHHFEH